MHEAAAIEAIPLERIFLTRGTLGLDDKSDTAGHRTLWRVPDVLRQEEDVAFLDNDIVEFALVENLQHHVAFELVKEFLDRVVVIVGALVRTAHDERHHVGVFPDLLVADGRLQ